MDLKKLAKHASIPSPAMHILSQAEKEVTLAVNLRVSDKRIIQCNAYLVFYNTVRGPAKGGIRFHRDVTLEHTAKLAELMVWKTALTGIPFGGGTSSVAVDPYSLTTVEKTALVKEFVHLIRSDLMAGDYIPAPDMGTTASDMSTIYGETHKLESVTGKPPRVGGLPGRQEATGRGVATTTDLLCQHLGLGAKGTTIAIQGFGNVGSWAGYFLDELGFKIVAVSDVAGGRYDQNGLDIQTLKQAVDQGGAIGDAGVGQKISNEDLFELGVDILIPAAVGKVITGDNAEAVRAKHIVEAANDPVDDAADQILGKRGITVVPDILANCGGVIASYVEWRKARSGSLTLRSETFEIIDTIITKAFDDVMALSKETGVELRTAAYVKAVSEVVKTMEDRGWL